MVKYVFERDLESSTTQKHPHNRTPPKASHVRPQTIPDPSAATRPSTTDCHAAFELGVLHGVLLGTFLESHQLRENLRDCTSSLTTSDCAVFVHLVLLVLPRKGGCVVHRCDTA